MEWRLFPEGTTPDVSTFEFHEHRERARHLEQQVHQERMQTAARFALQMHNLDPMRTIVDLGCGDGGMLQMLREYVPEIKAWGYDFTPANVIGGAERGVDVRQGNFLHNDIQWADIVMMTEVLEHVSDPHGVVRWVEENADLLICSSPRTETAESHDECHAWAWDEEGYANLLTDNGWEIVSHVSVGMFQVVLAQAARLRV